MEFVWGSQGDTPVPSDRSLAKNVYNLLVDPVELASHADASCFQRAHVAAAGLCHVVAVGVALSLVISAQGGYCYISWMRAWYRIMPGLACFSAVPGCCYSWVSIQKRRPRFVHIAGSFLLANTLAQSFMVMYFHEYCDADFVNRSWLSNMIIPGMTLQAVAGALLQYGILLKVEALLASPAKLLRALLTILIIPSLATMVMHICIIYHVLPWYAMWIEALFVLAMMILFSMFTCLAASSILRCQELLCEVRLEEAIRQRHRRTLTVHAVATVVANGTFLMSLAAFALSLSQGFRGNSPWFFVVANCVDNITNTICVALLSGLYAAFRGTFRHVDIISELASAGEEARSGPQSVTFGQADVDKADDGLDTIEMQPPGSL